MMEEDFGKTLDKEAHKLLGNIHFNANKMGNLVDDLLAFSRLGRKEVQKSVVNMDDMIGRILNEIENLAPHKASIKLNSLPSIEADSSLLNQVWLNLILNAIKYSAKKEKPKVEIGATESDTEVTYYVKDNGAGFSMEYADKLFGVFQRLHSPSEFEGTGIGLAIVHRIITKHGGRVWAEAKVNEGAIFYVALPKNEISKIK